MSTTSPEASRAISLWYYEENAAEHKASDVGKKKLAEGKKWGKPALNQALRDLSAATVQNARNKDFYHVVFADVVEDFFKRICDFCEIFFVNAMRLRLYGFY